MDKKSVYDTLLSFYASKAPSKAARSELCNELVRSLSYVDWAGFYEVEGDTLYLTTYVGSLACERIPVSNGVCGKCVREGKPQLVPNVHELPYHIACSSSTNSEIVLPIIRNGAVVAVLDLDSDAPSAFDEVDLKYLRELCRYM